MTQTKEHSICILFTLTAGRALLNLLVNKLEWKCPFRKNDSPLGNFSLTTVLLLLLMLFLDLFLRVVSFLCVFWCAICVFWLCPYTSKR